MSLRKSATYTIEGDPIPLFRARPNYDKRVMWDSQKNQRTYWKCLLARMHDDRPPFTGPLSLTVYCFIGLAVSKHKYASKYRNIYHESPPDASNILKWVEDCAEGVLYRNDCAIADARCIKLWCTRPRTVFVLTELDPQEHFSLDGITL